MKVKYLERFYVAGITVRTNNVTELNEETAQIPQLWQRYIDESIESKTFNKSNNSSSLIYFPNILKTFFTILSILYFIIKPHIILRL